jgi:hypothetical protein
MVADRLPTLHRSDCVIGATRLPLRGQCWHCSLVETIVRQTHERTSFPFNPLVNTSVNTSVNIFGTPETEAPKIKAIRKDCQEAEFWVMIVTEAMVRCFRS